MASPEQLAASYRAGQAAVTAATVRDAAKLWPALQVVSGALTYAAWEEAMTTLVQQNMAAAARLAGSYVEAAWAAGGLTGSPDVVLTGIATPDQVATSLRVTSLVAYRRSLGAGLTREAASRSALVQLAGSASRFVGDASRKTAAETTTANGGRWERVTSPGACAFCRMLAGRGAIYRTGVNFASHDHCGCSLASTFGVSGPVRFTPSTRRISDADRARVRTWLNANPDAA